ncbi:MAG: hypothetical protein IKN79_08320 [Eubacterium sp.]|nr:hypothetical protein [Eubacterium sp.]
MNKKKRKAKYLLIPALFLTAGAIFAALFLPGYFIRSGVNAELGTVSAVPTAYYSGPSEAVVQNASRQLTEEQRLSLIYGEWESTISPATPAERTLSEFEAVHLPFPIVSEYQQWYTWNAASYKAVDTTFETYAAVFWKCTFTRYDGKESLVYFITEGGTLLDPEKLPEELIQ